MGWFQLGGGGIFIFIFYLRAFPILLVPPPLLPGTPLVLTATAIIDTHTDRVGLDAPRVGQLELQPGVVVVEEMGGIVDVEELDKADPPAALVVAQPDHLDVLRVKHLGVGRHAREAVQDVILGRVVGQALDDEGRRGPARRWRVLSARGSGARAGPAVTVLEVAGVVIVREGAVVVVGS